MSSACGNTEWVETIVAEVMRRLVAQGVRVTAAEATAQTDLEMDARVISLATLSGRLEGIRRLVVKTDAIVTPSVRDELNQHDIELVRRTRGAPE